MTHLTEPELYALLDSSPGTPPPAESAAHLASCGRCRGELQELHASFSLLQHATSAYASTHAGALRVSSPAPKAGALSFLHAGVAGWATAAVLAAAAVIGVSSLSRHTPTPAVPAATSTVEPNASDEALLQSVSDEIDQPVPTSLRILAQTAVQNQQRIEARPERTN